MKGKLNSVVLALVLLLAACGCGYRFSGGGQMPGGVDRLAVAVFENRTGETGLESILTNSVINEFTRNTGVMITGKDEAEATLTGVIRSARSVTVSHRAAHVTAERQITVRVDLLLLTPAGNVIWSAKGIESSEDYIVSTEKIRTEQNKKSALVNLSEKLAQRIYYRLADQF